MFISRSTLQRLSKDSYFWLSLVLHAVLLLIFLLLVNLQPEEQKHPDYYVPSYVYKGSNTPTVQQHTAPSTQTAQKTPQTQTAQKQAEAAKTSKRSHKNLAVSKQGINLNSILASTQMIVQKTSTFTPPKAEDPIYLIGDDKEASDPLIKMLGRALSANFEYPRMAGEFGIVGRAAIAMTLHPEGYLSDIHLVKSSRNPDLDAAALYAVNKAPIVEGADRFISEPKEFVIGFIFDTAENAPR